MKRTIPVFAILLLSTLVSSAQVPQKFNYQAVVRNAQHAVISNQEVGFKLSILAGSPGGSPVYVETHSVTTNAVGLAGLVIGEGTVSSGTFADILWGENAYYLKVEVDPSGGSSYEHLGTSQMISVPYSLWSGNISSPTRKFTVQEEPGHPVDSALFEVRNAEGQTVFAVYPEGTRVYVLDEEAKGRKGGFAVGGYSRKTKGITQEYMHVSPDSIRLYFDDESSKGRKGGFAVGGYSRKTKGTTDQYFELKPDSARFTLVSDQVDGFPNALSVVTKQKTGSPDEFTSSSLFNLTRENYFIGHRAGESITSGTGNSFIGFESGVHTTSGRGNIFIGEISGFHNVDGVNNTFIGPSAGQANVSGTHNVFLGNAAGHQHVEGDNNVYIGESAGGMKTRGLSNTFIGTRAGFNNMDGNDNILIGFEAGMDHVGSGELIIDLGSHDVNQALIFGELYNNKLRINNQLGIGRNAELNALEVEGEVSKTTAGTILANSDARIKTDIIDIENACEIILGLHPVKFRYTDAWMEKNPVIKDKVYYNFIAQEFAEVFPEAVQRGGDNMGEGENLLQLDSHPANVVAIRAIQELAEQNREQQAVIDDLLRKVSALEAEISGAR
ncbi:MAG: tail fiber domain-containing protein [Bacteroidota bacterium]